MGGGEPSSSGVTVNEEGSLTITTVYACCRIIAETIASLPLQVFERTEDGNEIAREHPIYSLLHDEPNTLQTSYYFRETHTAAAVLWGNGYAAIERRGASGRPSQLIPIQSDRVEPQLNGRELQCRHHSAREHPTFSGAGL
jgi:HK97 family phage portal protein